MKYPEKYTNPREYIVNTFSGNEYVVDSENRLVVPFPDGTKDLITSKSLCSGKSTTYSSSEEGDGTSSTNPSSIASGVITSRLFIGDYLALDGINGIITIGIPKTGLVGDNPYMMFGSSGIYGMYGDTDQPWFVVSMAEATYTYIDPDTLTQSTKTFQGGDFFIGNYETAYLYWEYATHKLTIAGDVIIAGDLESANFVIGPPIVGYKLEHTTGNAYFGGAVISGDSVIGDGTTTATTLGNAIDASGHFADSAINTATGTIITPFSFGTSGAIQIGTYSYGSTGDIRISPNGILGRDNTGATTFSINGTTGIAVLNGLVVGTNVGLGTAEDSAGVTTIIGDTVTTTYVNALSVVAGSVAAENITGTYITGKTVQTATSGDRIILNGSNNTIEFKNGSTLYAEMEPYSSSGNVGLFISTPGTYHLASMFVGESTTTSLVVLSAAQIQLVGPVTASTSLSTPSITLNGSTRTSWPSSGTTTLSGLSIDTSKNWSGYNITNFGSLIPGSGTTALGNSTYYWNDLYLGVLRGPFGTNPITLGNNLEGNNVASLLNIVNADINGYIDCEGCADFATYVSIHGVLYMNNQQIRDVANPTNAQDATTKKWVEDNFVAK